MTLWRAPTWTGRLVVRLLSAIAPLAQALYARPRLLRDLTAFVLAAALLTPLDALQQHAGILTGGAIPALAWVRFGILGAALAEFGAKVDARPKPASLGSVFTHVAFFALAYGLTAFLEFGIAGALLALFAFRVWRALREGIPMRELFPFFALLTIGGPLLEIAGVKLGLFAYTHPGPEGVPYWLGLLWANGTFAARDLFSGSPRPSAAASGSSPAPSSEGSSR